MHAWQRRKDHNGVPQNFKKVAKEERKCCIFSSKLQRRNSCPARAERLRTGMAWWECEQCQTPPFTPPALPILPSSWHSSCLEMLKHKPGILLSPFQLFPRFSQCSHHSSDDSRSEAALCGEPRSFVTRKKSGSLRWPSFFRAELCTSSTKQFLWHWMRLLPGQWNFIC